MYKKRTFAAVHDVEWNSRNIWIKRQKTETVKETVIYCAHVWEHSFIHLFFSSWIPHVSRPSCFRWAPVFAVRVSSSSPSAVSEQRLLSYSDRSSLQQTTNTTEESSPLGCREAEEHCPTPDNTQLHTPSGWEVYKKPL